MLPETIQIYQENCLPMGGADTGLNRLAAGSVRLIVADPPYFTGATSKSSVNQYHDIYQSQPFYLSFFQQCHRVLVEDGVAFVFCDKRLLGLITETLYSAELNMISLPVWHKGTSGRPGHIYSYDTEFIVLAGKGSYRNYPYRSRSSVWQINRVGNKRIHPSQKPVKIYQNMIEDTTEAGDLVVDPFLGSGASAVAAQNLGRRHVGFEIHLPTYQLALDRIIKDTQQIPLKL